MAPVASGFLPECFGKGLICGLPSLGNATTGANAHKKIIGGTAEFHHEITDALLPQADPVFDDATALDTAVDMLDPQPPLVQRLVGPLLLQGQLLAPRGFFVGMRISTCGSVNARKPRSCNNRLPAGKGYGVASAMGLSWVRPP